MPINKKLCDLDDGETCIIEAVVTKIIEPPEGKKAFRVKLAAYEQTFYSNCALNLVKPGTKLSMTIKASEFQSTLYYWIQDWQRVQSEELPFK